MYDKHTRLVLFPKLVVRVGVGSLNFPRNGVVVLEVSTLPDPSSDNALLDQNVQDVALLALVFFLLDLFDSLSDFFSEVAQHTFYLLCVSFEVQELAHILYVAFHCHVFGDLLQGMLY